MELKILIHLMTVIQIRLPQRSFVEATHVDALAISFGTTHGVYLTEPKLDLNRITAIKKTD